METQYARPEGTRQRLQEAIKCLQELQWSIYIPGDFHARATALIVDMQRERRRLASDVLPDANTSCCDRP